MGQEFNEHFIDWLRRCAFPSIQLRLRRLWYFSVIRSLRLYAILLPTQPDFSSSVEVRQPSHNTNHAAAA